MNMRNGKGQFILVAVLLMVAAIWLFPSMSEGKPKAPPWQNSEEQRDGYSRSIVVDANSVLFTVPQGKRYVMVRLYARVSDTEPPYWWENEEFYDRSVSFWAFTIDGELFLDEFSIARPEVYVNNATSITIDGLLEEDFPDKCVVIEGGQTLAVTKLEAVDKVGMTLIGYFCDMP